MGIESKKHNVWVERGETMSEPYYECEKCGYRTDDLDDSSECPNCNEEMDEVQDHNPDEEEEQ